MLKKKAMTAAVSFALIGAMTLPAFAAGDLPISPNQTPLTRAELVSALYELEGKPEVSLAAEFTDVSPDDGYADAVGWAASQGIANGYGNGMFGPDDPVTREQTAVILYRYTQSKDQGFTGAWAFPLPYEDAEEISGFAYEAICWMTMKDVMGDTEDNLFRPQEQVTHQDAAALWEAYGNAIEETQIPNPFVSCKTMEDAAELAGFSMDLPADLPSWGAPAEIRAVESGMIEVTYQKDGQQLTVRKGVGTEDISGDYNTYPEAGTEELHGTTVAWKGDDGKIMVATWSSDGYTYAVQAETGLAADDLFPMIAAIK